MKRKEVLILHFGLGLQSSWPQKERHSKEASPTSLGTFRFLSSLADVQVFE